MTINAPMGKDIIILGQFPVLSFSIGKIHSSSLTLIRLIYSNKMLLSVWLYTIPSIVRVFVCLIRHAITCTLKKSHDLTRELNGGKNTKTTQGIPATTLSSNTNQKFVQLLTF